jgi:hypothetical protein
MTNPPAPLEWHPAYRGHTQLLDWLEGDSIEDRFVLPVMVRARVGYYQADAPVVIPKTFKAHTLVKREAQGLAPYVGRPFIYRWMVAVDELGRGVGGESRIVHIDDHGYYWGWENVPSRNGHAPDWP